MAKRKARKTIKRKTAKKRVTKKTVKKKTSAKRRTTPKRTTKRTSCKCTNKSKKGVSYKNYKALNALNDKLDSLESQALKAYECVQAIRKRSTPEWKKWIDSLSSKDWSKLANAQRERISTEIKHLSDEILSRIHCADILVAKHSILNEAKANLESTVNKVDHGDLVDKAIDTAMHTKDGLLAFLNIPTHNEMTQLQRKLKRLERRMSQLAE